MPKATEAVSQDQFTRIHKIRPMRRAKVAPQMQFHQKWWDEAWAAGWSGTPRIGRMRIQLMI